MEIPDLNYKQQKQVLPNGEVDDFYTVKASQTLSEQETILEDHTYEHNFKSIVEDLILKKTMNISWQERYFCLTSHRLIYYTSSKKDEVKGCFNFASLSIYSLLLQVREEQKILKLLVYVMSNNKSQSQHEKQLLTLNFERIPQRFSIWKNELNKIIQINSFKIYKHLVPPNVSIQNIVQPQLKINGDNFWNKIYLSAQQFSQFSGQLDIIFFKSKKPMAAFHRLLMRSNFDHVGLLLKDPHNRLLVLEAIQTRGVWVNDWEQMLPVFKQHYQQIAYKKLIFDQKSHKLDIKKLEIYLDSIIGKKYQLSLSKLIVGQNESTSEDLQKQNKKDMNKMSQKVVPSKIGIGGNKQKTYFCSQLIADVYIKLGLLRGKKNQFWPRDFQNETRLQNNARLGPLMYLAF